MSSVVISSKKSIFIVAKIVSPALYVSLFNCISVAEIKVKFCKIIKTKKRKKNFCFCILTFYYCFLFLCFYFSFYLLISFSFFRVSSSSLSVFEDGFGTGEVGLGTG